MQIILRNFDCTRTHIPVESLDAMQSIFNCAGEFAKVAFDHAPNGSEAIEFLRLILRQPTAEVAVYEVIYDCKVSKSVGLIAVQYAPEIRQSIFALVLIDKRYRGMGIGTEALALAESKLNPQTEYVCAMVSLADQKTLTFWRNCGYLPESEYPASINTTFFHQDLRYARLVKEVRAISRHVGVAGQVSQTNIH